ncbi:glycosyltransferase [bacterium]|nr:glycosyltransferase [bacterium]
MFFKLFRALYAVLSAAMIFGVTRIRKKRGVSIIEELPSLAIVVAARNEAKHITDLLAALANQSYPEDKVQFWIVDDDSDDQTYAIAKAASDRDSRFHVLHSKPNPDIPSPKKRALNTAIVQIESEWIVTTDADCIPGPGWLLGLAEYMDDSAGIVVGYSPLFGGKSPVQWLIQGESWSAASLAASGIGAGYPFNATGRNFAFRRQIYLDLGGYGKGIKFASGDDDLFMQYVVSRTNWKVAFADDPRTWVKSRIATSPELIKAKVRHMSVGTQYAIGWVIFGALGAALFMSLALLPLLGWIGVIKKEEVTKLWLWKWTCDIFMTVAGWRLLPDTYRAILALFTMTAAPYAFWYIWPKALFGTVHWKGRNFKRGRATSDLHSS